MNTRHVIDESSGPIALSVAFNQESNYFAIGLDTGFCIFQSDPCELISSRDFNAGVTVVEMLGRTNLLALVGGGKQPKFPQNKVILWDDIKQRVKFTLEFRTQALRVKLSRQRIIVVLQNSVHTYALESPPQKLSVYETADNLHGLCCLGSGIIAFPGRTPGQVQLLEADTGNVSIIPAHGTPLRAMELSPDGEILATASETGTLVRIFSTRNCSKLAELRRGVDHASIFSLSLSPDGTLLAVTSDKSTLHVFDLPHANSLPNNHASPGGGTDEGETPSQKWGFMGKIPFLPRVFSDTYSFASAPFATGDDPGLGIGSSGGLPVPIPGIPGGKPVKGVARWLDNHTILVIGAGRDGRWERFVIGTADDGKRYCTRNGWKRYLGK